MKFQNDKTTSKYKATTSTSYRSSLFVGSSGGQVYALESLAEEEDVKFEVNITPQRNDTLANHTIIDDSYFSEDE